MNDESTMCTATTASSCGFIYNQDSCLYEDFINSLSEVRDKSMLMGHLPSTVNIASKIFGDYLTKEELQERQYEGRFWDMTYDDILYILVDNNTVVIVKNTNKRDTLIIERDSCDTLPDNLRGRYYFDEH